jgi:hypothetical protein
MYAVTLQCVVPEDRTLTVRLPDSIQPGVHEVMLIIGGTVARPPLAVHGGLMRFSGVVPSLSGVDGLAAQHASRAEWQ